MSAEDKAKNAGQKAAGKVKEGVGKATDDKSLREELEHGSVNGETSGRREHQFRGQRVKSSRSC
jgi:uncharacterized protein YjbJ (UPF0337 family)